MGPLEIRPVEGARDASLFEAFPYLHYRDDPLWVAPLRSEESARWKRTHPTLRSRTAARFLALRDGRCVGRIAAIQDPEFAERWEPGSGFFGFFECGRDEETALALLGAAERWLGDRGIRRVLGPVNLSFHNEVGLLTGGDGTTPMILSPYNPDYYPALLERAGYVPRASYHAYLWTPASRHTKAAERILRAARLASGVRIRCFDRR